MPPATSVTPASAVTPTTPMMPVTAETTAEAGTPAAAHEICGDSQKIIKMSKTHSTYTKHYPKLIPLFILSLSGMVISPLKMAL
jgi:hypothetical protein